MGQNLKCGGNDFWEKGWFRVKTHTQKKKQIFQSVEKQTFLCKNIFGDKHDFKGGKRPLHFQQENGSEEKNILRKRSKRSLV